jgi:predicted transglutaminase-like cysteine proteinase
MLLEQITQIWDDVNRVFKYQPDEAKVKILADTWEPDSALQPSELGNVKFTGICESFARVCLARCTAVDIKARLVVCYDETGEGHCITEVSDGSGTVAYYLDNRQEQVVVRAKLVGYKFLGVSPWNPVPGDTRPWFLVT